MDENLNQLADYILDEIGPNYQDFRIFVTEKSSTEITVDCWKRWEKRDESAHNYSFYTIKHDGVVFTISKWGWSDKKNYRTLRGIKKYVFEDLVGYCNAMRGHRDKALAEKKHKEEARIILEDLHKTFAAGGSQSRLCLTDAGYLNDHVAIVSAKYKLNIDITVGSDKKTLIYFSYPRLYIDAARAKELIPLL